MADIKYEIMREIGVLSENARGWRKELNLVSWNGAAPKYDIREWAPDHEKMGKGITLTAEELKQLASLAESE
ncbi:MAG: YdbC family protein [Oscillospiraceae bacterium]|nr:YdbC family protein [Oscillospiraceae bacterium]MBQ8979352.1 YdbC family protein [Oscillospiraceae bacterium]